MSTRATSKTAASRSGLLGRIRRLIADTRTEIRKVSWPDAETTRNLTILVIVMATVLGAVLGAIDAIFIRLWEAIPS